MYDCLRTFHLPKSLTTALAIIGPAGLRDRLQKLESGRMVRKPFALAASCLVSILTGCVAGAYMSQDEIVSSWVGHNIGELKSQWDLTWYDSTNSEQTIYTLYANFGEDAYVRDDSYTQQTPGGPNVIIQENVEQYTQVPSHRACTVYFNADARSLVISDYKIEGNCKGYIEGWGPAPGSAGGRASTRPSPS